MSLRTYRAKRDFQRAPEPSGKRARGRPAALSFVVQKHAARRLHHDFRLELDGVLLSWAVPKGLPSKVGAKALAVRTEDHPLEYGSFEGVIPPGEYGGGAVMLWDRGTWSSDGDPRAGLAAGRLNFELDGERLRGRWTLVRTAMGAEDGKHWLAVKRSDVRKDARAEPFELDRSIATQRSMAEIAAGKAPRTVRKMARGASTRKSAARKAQPPKSGRSKQRPRKSRVKASDLNGARRRRQPARMAPQLATLVDAPPDGDEWLHEIKYDGYRVLAALDRGAVRLWTRGGQDWTARFPEVAAALSKLPVEHAWIDGEVVVLARDGTSSFQALQRSMKSRPFGDDGGAGARVFFAFDLPHCDGYDLTSSPLLERKQLLETLLEAAAENAVLRPSRHVRGGGSKFFEHACELALEGAVSKRANARYEPGRSRLWLKTKCLHRQEFVVVGWTESESAGRGLGSLLLGVREPDGELRFAGRVGSGFDARALEEVSARLVPLSTPKPPLADPPRGAATRRVHWVRPRLVVEVEFSEWTADGSLRHPTFQGVREDKQPEEIMREKPLQTRKQTDETVIAGVELSHPERVLYPEQGITKRGLAMYYDAVADALLPHVSGRPLMLLRCPRGRGQKCFFQKHSMHGLPESIRTTSIAEKNGERADYLTIDDREGLIALVQHGVLELHPWGSRADRPEQPDRIVIDLDPGPGVAWTRVVEGAHAMRGLLTQLGLESFVRTTGGKGLHVVLPIERRLPWNDIKEFTRDLAAALAARNPKLYELTASKSHRRGRIYLDVLRNTRGATAVACYSARARVGAPVATPVAWEELEPALDPLDFTIETTPRRVAARRADPWTGFFELRQSLTKAMRAAVLEL
jgi:bifunctional non-homologous end joining protein LigD